MKKFFKCFSFLMCVCITMFCCTACSLFDGFGKSAYDIAIEHGFVGTEEEWLESLKGKDGSATDKGDSTYEIAKKNGFVGTEEEWLNSLLNSLKNDDGNLEYSTNKAMRSVVDIKASKQGFDSLGSGVIVDYNISTQIAHIFTCFHVIVDTNKISLVSSNIKISFFGEPSFVRENYNVSAFYIGGDINYDIAILSAHIDKTMWNRFNLRVADVELDSGYLGETTLTLGDTNGKGLNAVRGSISHPLEIIDIKNLDGSPGYTKLRTFRHDAIITHGNSGGGIFNSKGELIGIVNAKSLETEESNFNYAIPISIAKAIYDNVLFGLEHTNLSYIHVKRCTVGLNLTIKGLYSELKRREIGDSFSENLIPCHIVTVENNTKDFKVGDELLFAKIMRDGKEVKSKEIKLVYDLPELMYYATTSDSLFIKYKDVHDGNKVKTVTMPIINTINPATARKNLFLA